MKLFLYSSGLSSEQATALAQLVGKEPNDITFALIENAADVVPALQNWLEGFRDALRHNGFQLEQIDLGDWQGNLKGLREKLASKDVIWFGGGNTFYLRWILRDIGADDIIRELIQQGKVYAGWSAGAVIAGPTLQYIDIMDDPEDAPEVIWEGLNLTNLVVVPHLDNTDFVESAKQANQQLEQAGYRTVPLNDNQVLIINGDEHKVI